MVPHPPSSMKLAAAQEQLNLYSTATAAAGKLLPNGSAFALPPKMKQFPDMSSEENSIRKRASTAAGAPQADFDDRASPDPRRVCRICFKEFSSGRALGGHMRIHGPFYMPGSGSGKANAFKKQKLEPEAAAAATADRSSSKFGDRVQFSDSETEDEAMETSFESKQDRKQHHLSDDMAEVATSVDEYSGRRDEDDDDDVVDGEFLRPVSMYGDFNFAEFSGNFGAMENSKKNPLYKLRDNPKPSHRFTAQDFTTETYLPALRNVSSAMEFDKKASVQCSVCHKVFVSSKALFGHMRCHPEREWRGILPPDVFNSESNMEKVSKKRHGDGNSTSVELESMDIPDQSQKVKEEEGKVLIQECVLPSSKAKSGGEPPAGSAVTEDGATRWPTGKRSKRKALSGKSGSFQTSSSPEDEPDLSSETTSLELGEEEHVSETPNFLLMLAEAARRMEEEKEKVSNKAVKEQELSSKPKQAAISANPVKLSSKDEDHCDEVKPYVASSQTQTPPRPSVAEEDPMPVNIINSGGVIKYECVTCKKTFNSHQALGGHRASHRKMKGCFAKGEDTIEFTGEDNELLLLRASPTQIGSMQEKDMALHSSEQKERKKQPQQLPQLLSGKGHECTICHRVFSSGQALGGHKRCHWTGEKPAAESTSVTSTNNKQAVMNSAASSSSAGAQSSKVNTEAGILDLNLPAPEDDGNDFEEVQRKELPLFGEDSGSTVCKYSNENSAAMAGCKFNGLWKQQWSTEAVTTEFPQICALQST